MISKGTKARQRKLIDEIQILTIALSTVIIIAVQVTSMFVISYAMGANLKDDAMRVADELAAHLAEPLYNIVSIADVYDALVSERVYKPPFTVEEALSIIRKERGVNFDPALTDIFLSGMESLQPGERYPFTMEDS